MNAFQKARLTLTFWYILISFLLLFVFSLAAIQAEKRAFSRIQQVLGNRAKRPHLTSLLEKRIDEFEANFQMRLLFFDGILLVIVSGASYFLSGKTLKPIQEMIEEQEAFAAEASHELRTPLTTIGMEIEALRRTEKTILPQYKTVLDSIQEEVSRMRRLVDGLLVLVRNAGENSKKSWKACNFTSIVEESSSQMQPLAKEKDIRIEKHLAKDVAVMGDPEQIKEVVLILIDNAIKYSSTHGQIVISLQKTKSSALLSVTDTGHGIDPKDLPHIFTRSYRGGTTDSHQQSKGAGLGLSIAKRIVAQHDGTISVESTLHKGSTFIIKLSLSS